jgi:hypothetical protein
MEIVARKSGFFLGWRYAPPIKNSAQSAGQMMTLSKWGIFTILPEPILPQNNAKV